MRSFHPWWPFLAREGHPLPVKPLLDVVAGAMLAQAGVHILRLAIEIAAMTAGAPGATSVAEAAPALAGVYKAASFVYLVAALMGVVAWFLWLARSVSNLIATGSERWVGSPSGMLLAYVVPPLWFWRPVQDLDRLLEAFREDASWLPTATPTLVRIWWAALWLHAAAFAGQWVTGFSPLTLVCSFLGVQSAVLGLLVIRRFMIVQSHWSRDNAGTKERRLVQYLALGSERP